MTSKPDPGRPDLPREWQQLALQLEALEARGRRSLQATQRRLALDRALSGAGPAALGVPVLWLLSGGRWADLDLRLPLAVASVLVPALVGGAIYGAIRSRQQVSRDEALTLLDQQLALKDRLTACAALLEAPQRSGFEQAALLEAAPWVARSLEQAPQPLPPTPLKSLRRYAWCLPAALLMGLFAWWLPMRFATPAGPDPRKVVVAGPADGMPASSVHSVLTSDRVVTPPEGEHRAEAPQGRSALGSPEAGQASPSRPVPVGSGGAGAPPSAASAARSLAGGARPGPSAAATTAAEAAAGAHASSNGHPGETQAPPPAAPQPGPSAQAAPAGAGQDDSQASTSSGEPRSRGQQEAPSQRGAQPPPSDKSSESSQRGQPQNNSRSKGGNDGQNDGNGSGEGQNNGSHKGQESGPKSGRGFATLLLARPMRDQVQGQASAGPVISVLQQGQPQGQVDRRVQAGDRGHLADDAAVLTPPSLTASDRLLLRNYFAREAQPLAPLASQPAPAGTETRKRP